jgi:hypothetical protein
MGNNRITLPPPADYPSADLLRKASREVHEVARQAGYRNPAGSTHPTRKDLPAAKKESQNRATVREMKAVGLR